MPPKKRNQLTLKKKKIVGNLKNPLENLEGF